MSGKKTNSSPAPMGHDSWRRCRLRRGITAITLASICTAALTMTSAAQASPTEDPEVHVAITSPASGVHGLYAEPGNTNMLAFKASANFVGGGSCCTITWSSDVDHSMGTGKSLNYMFRTPGKRTVTATASTTFNGHAITDSTSITVFADNVKPVVDITAPAAGATLWSKLPYAFAGNSGDLNGVSLASAQGALPCDLLAWTVSGPSFSSWTGCHPEVPFPSAGSYSVVLKGTDRFGLSGTTSRSVTVVNQQPQTAPTASILQPAVNSAFWNGSPVTLKGGAHDVDNDAMTYKWEVRKEGTTTWTLIDTKKDTQWVPNVSTDSQCSPVRLTLRFTATDNDGSRPPVEVQVFVFVC